VAERLRAAVLRLDTRTPPGRDRALDGLRALAILGVVLGHWMVGALVLGADGALTVDSPLRTQPGLAPASWLLQMLGLFFLVGGYVAAAGWTSASARGTGYAEWLRQRALRLGRPVVAVVLAWAVAVPALGILQVPRETLHSAVALVLQPLWFVGVYLVATALTRAVLWLDARLGRWAPVPALAVVAVVDALRYGPWADAVPGAVGLVSLLPGWLFGYQLGVAWYRGRLGGAAPWVLLVGGAALFAVLLNVFDYPASLVGVPGEARTNAHPPSLLVLALAATQSGAALLLRARIAGLLARPGLWAGVVVLNVAAMSILCWHQTAALVPAITAAAGGWNAAGLVGVPADAQWLLARAAWLPVLGVLLALACAAVRRFERPPVVSPSDRRQQVAVITTTGYRRSLG